jgi:hypothetical protein
MTTKRKPALRVLRRPTASAPRLVRPASNRLEALLAEAAPLVLNEDEDGGAL